MKTFHEQFDVGKTKYLVSFHDGIKKHDDGSLFFDVRIFNNKKKKDAFITTLILKGYKNKKEDNK